MSNTFETQAADRITHTAFENYFGAWMKADPNDALWTEAGWVTTHTNLGENGTQTVLEDWQVYLLNNPAGYSWWGKSRQVGFSWAEAMKKLARSDLLPKIYNRRYLGIFLSLNQDEAKEKIFYMLAAHATLPKELQNGALKLVRESTDALEFANGARIFSYPAKAVRGKAGADITLDEFAHIPKVKSVYEGTTAATIRGSSGSAAITIGSTPLTETDLFYEIGHNERQYKSFAGQRYYVRWWDSAAICRDVIGARRAAVEESWLSRSDYDSVQERVSRFGTERLQQEFGGLPLESFLQEYESAFGANKNAFIPYGLLVNAIETSFPQVMFLRPGMKSEVGFMDDVLPELDKALELCSEIGAWVGYDVARKKDYAALVILSPMVWDDRIRLAVVGRFLFRDVPYHLQEALLDKLLSDNRVNKVRIDATGSGGTISENLVRKWGDVRVDAVTFTNGVKLAMASRLKLLFEKGELLMTGDREILRQVASIEKNVTASGNIVIDGSTEDSHADVFWALALAAEQAPLSVEAAPPEAALRGNYIAEEADDALREINLREQFNVWARHKTEETEEPSGEWESEY